VSYLVRISLTGRTNAPAQLCEWLREARGLFRRFHCFNSSRIVRQPCQRTIPKVLVGLGELRGVIYQSNRGRCGRSRTFIHFFKTPPQLTCDARGTQLYIQGGRYRVTQRGVEG
jgi:hypothetical protein